MLNTLQIKELAKGIASEIQWPEVMSLRTAARYIDRSEKAVRHLIEDRVLPSTRIDAKVQLRRRDIDAAFEAGLI